MSKLALFVEGQTEALFAERLLREMAGAVAIQIDSTRASGPRGCRSLVQLSGTSTLTNASFYALIRDCACDSQVVSDLVGEYESLRAAGFTMIVGLRDVFPLGLADVAKLRARIQQEIDAKVQGRSPDVRVVLAVMEVEAWFLAEHTHLGRVDVALTCAEVLARLGFDPSVVDVERRPHPADDLRSIYNIVGRGYVKSRTQVQATLDALDYEALYVGVRQRVPSLNGFLGHMDEFLT